MLKKSRILWKQVLLYSLIFFALILALVYLVYTNLEDVSQKYISLSQYSVTGSRMLDTDKYFDTLMLAATQVSHDTEVISMMEKLSVDDGPDNYFLENVEKRMLLASILKRHNPTQSPMYRISVYNTTGDYVCDSPTLENLAMGSEATRDENLIRLLEAPDEKDFRVRGPLTDPYGGEDSPVCLSMILPIADPDTEEIYGYVEIQQLASVLYDTLDSKVREYLTLFIFKSQDTERTSPVYPLGGTFPANQEDYYITTHHSEYGLDIVMLRDRSTLMVDFYPIFRYLLVGVIALYVLLVGCVFLVSAYTNKPIIQLNEKVKEVTLDHIPDRRVTNDAADEVQELEHSFDLMVQRLNTSFQLEKKAYLNALQAQMNPHFLYNCLSTIAGMCIVGRTQDIPEFCNCLADILRYETTYENKPVTLQDELKNVTDYLELMKLRYETDFTYELAVDESLLQMPLPRLVLQPIVENCFEHGFRDMAPPWRIRVEVSRNGSQWRITVADNGCGLSEDMRQQLLRQMDEAMERYGENYTDLQIGGLGLVNTITRLRLLTEDRVSCSIDPGDPQGTIVTLKGTWKG